MLQLTLKLHGPYYTDDDNVEVFDVDGSVLTPIAVPGRDGGKIYSKYHFVYVVFKSDDKVDMFYNKGISVKYSAIKTGKTIIGCGEGTERYSRTKSPSQTQKTLHKREEAAAILMTIATHVRLVDYSLIENEGE